MKRFLSQSAALAALAVMVLTACDNKSTDISRSEDVEIKVAINHVLSPFTAYDQSDTQMYVNQGIASQIEVVALLYDDAGHLVKQMVKDVANYNQPSVTFTTPVTGNNPTLVCFSLAFWTTKSGIAYEVYQISGEELLSTLKVERQYDDEADLLPWIVLGGSIQQLGATATRVDVELEPLGAVVYSDWHNVHANDNKKPRPGRYVIYRKCNDAVCVENKRFVYRSSLSSTYYYYQGVMPSSMPNYDELYRICFIMPGEVDVFGFGQYSPSNFAKDDAVATGETSKQTMSIKQGKQYVIDMNCADYTIATRQGVMQ